MIDKEELLNNKDFYKSFKNGEDLTSFFKQMHKRAVEHMLDAELDAHLDNEKHEKTTTGNYRNGHGTKKIKSSFGESQIKVPRDREGSFEPALVPKRHNIIDGLENIIISFLLKKKIVEGEYQFSPYDLQAINQLKEEKYATTQWNFQATAPK